MPLLLRPSAPSPSIDELSFVVTAAPLSAQTSQRAVSSAMSEGPRCTTHSQLLLPSRHRGSTASTDTEFAGCDDDASNYLEHCHLTQRVNHPSLRHNRSVTTTKSKDAENRNSKRLSHDTQPDDDHVSSNGSFVSEAGRVSSLRSCGCSCADANEFAITSSFVGIEDRQLAVVDKELRDLRKTLVRKLYSRLTKISVLKRRKSTTAKPVV